MNGENITWITHRYWLILFDLDHILLCNDSLDRELDASLARESLHSTLNFS